MKVNQNIVTMLGFVQIKSPSVTKPFYLCDKRVAEAVRRWAIGIYKISCDRSVRETSHEVNVNESSWVNR